MIDGLNISMFLLPCWIFDTQNPAKKSFVTIFNGNNNNNDFICAYVCVLMRKTKKKDFDYNNLQFGLFQSHNCVLCEIEKAQIWSKATFESHDKTKGAITFLWDFQPFPVNSLSFQLFKENGNVFHWILVEKIVYKLASNWFD